MTTIEWVSANITMTDIKLRNAMTKGNEEEVARLREELGHWDEIFRRLKNDSTEICM